MTDEESLANVIEMMRQDDIWKRVERYIDWKAGMVIAASYLCVAIGALQQAEFGLAKLNGYPELDNGTLRSELGGYEFELEKIRDMLVETQAQLRRSARMEFTGQTDEKEGEE